MKDSQGILESTSRPPDCALEAGLGTHPKLRTKTVLNVTPDSALVPNPGVLQICCEEHEFPFRLLQLRLKRPNDASSFTGGSQVLFEIDATSNSSQMRPEMSF